MYKMKIDTITIKEKTPIKFRDGEEHNPFNYDFFHMGRQIGKNTFLMFRNHSDDSMDYCILVNTKTGQRFEIEFDETWQ